jgi:hypothetical protein
MNETIDKSLWYTSPIGAGAMTLMTSIIFNGTSVGFVAIYNNN